MAKLIGSTNHPTVTLPLDRFGPAGTRGELHIVAQFPGDRRSDASRINDNSERQFTNPRVKNVASFSPIPPVLPGFVRLSCYVFDPRVSIIGLRRQLRPERAA